MTNGIGYIFGVTKPEENLRRRVPEKHLTDGWQLSKGRVLAGRSGVSRQINSSC